MMVEPGPNFSVADVHRGYRKAFEDLGCTVANLNYADRLSFYSAAGKMVDGEFTRYLADNDAVRMASKGVEAACYEFWPDVVVVTSGFFIPLDTLQVMQARGHKVVLMHTESPYEDERQLQRAQFATLNLLNDPTNLARFEALGPAMYLPHAYDPAIHHPGGTPHADDVSDFFFVGTAYPSRIEFFEQVDWDGIDVALAGNWSGLTPDSFLHKFLVHDVEQCLENTEAVDLYRGTKVSANLYRREAEADHLVEGWAMGPREVEMAACETFFVRDPRPEGDELFPMLPTFTSPAEFGEQVRWWLKHDIQRQAAAASARAAIADRTFTNNASRLLAVLETL
jgi:spore maturation protein CgeB